MATTPTPATKSPATPGHGWRITWPMVVGWIAMLSLLWPVLGPYVLGEKHFDAAAGATILAALVAVLTHSPAPGPGGGLTRPPSTVLLLAFALPLVGILHGCGASTATRASYGVEEARCVANERAIVDRAGTTAEQDQADLAAERSRCDAALAVIGGAR